MEDEQDKCPCGHSWDEHHKRHPEELINSFEEAEEAEKQTFAEKSWQVPIVQQAEKEKAEYELKPLPYAANALQPFLSKKVVDWHHKKHQQGYVDKRNEIVKALKSAAVRDGANMNYSQYGELKRRESFNANGIMLHERYWDSLGGDGKYDDTLLIIEQIDKDFGSYDNWMNDFSACGKASLGWAVLAWDSYTQRLHNYMCDFHNNGVVFGAMPIVALDLFEHAYYHDYGPDRAKYIDGFYKKLDWERINKCLVSLTHVEQSD